MQYKYTTQTILFDVLPPTVLVDTSPSDDFFEGFERSIVTRYFGAQEHVSPTYIDVTFREASKSFTVSR
jgi:hypothetical protein